MLGTEGLIVLSMFAHFKLGGQMAGLPNGRIVAVRKDGFYLVELDEPSHSRAWIWARQSMPGFRLWGRSAFGVRRSAFGVGLRGFWDLRDL